MPHSVVLRDRWLYTLGQSVVGCGERMKSGECVDNCREPQLVYTVLRRTPAAAF
jgi:hypothetical protein